MMRTALALWLWCSATLFHDTGSATRLAPAFCAPMPLQSAPALQSVFAQSNAQPRLGFHLSFPECRTESLRRHTPFTPSLSGSAVSDSGAGASRDEDEVRAFLQGLKRADLQSLAKDNNIAANKKSSEIIEKLLLARRSRSVELHLPETSVGEGSSDMTMRVENDLDTPPREQEDEGGIEEAAVDLSSQLGGLGAVVVFPTHGDFELELPLMAAEFGAQKDSVRGTLNADEMIFFPPHRFSAGDGVNGIRGQVAVMQRGGGLSFVKKALIAQELGASTLIVANTDDELFRPGDPSGEGDGVSIPVWLIGAKDSTALQDGLRVEISRLRTDLIAQDFEIVEKRTQGKPARKLARPTTLPEESGALKGGLGREHVRRTESLQAEGKAQLPRSSLGAGEKRRGERMASRSELEGVTLKDMVTWLSIDIGWDEMARATGLKVFASNPSVSSSLKMLRQKDNEWARQKVEKLYQRNLKRRL